jgi:hypothetical protein
MRARKFGDIAKVFRRAAATAPTEHAKSALRAYARECALESVRILTAQQKAPPTA